MDVSLKDNYCSDIYSDIFNRQKQNLLIRNTENTHNYLCKNLESTVVLFNQFKIENLEILINFNLLFLSLISINDLKTLFNIFTEYSNWHRNDVKIVLMFEDTVDLNEVMKTCWQYFIINVIVLNNKKVHTYYPYNNGNCGRNITAEFLTSYADIKRTNLFPKKVPNNLYGCEVKLGIIKLAPFAQNITKNLDDPRLAGLEVTIMHMIAKTMNFDEIFSDKDLNWGFQASETYNQALQMVENKEIDIIYGHTHAYFGDSKLVDKTINHLIDVDKIWIPSAPQIEKWKNLLVIFKLDVWISLLLAMTEVSIGWWIIAHVKKEYLFLSYKKCLLRVFGLLLQNPYKLPKSIILRISFVLWCAGGLVIAAAYTSKLITSLLAPFYVHQITTIDELLQMDFIAIALEKHQIEYFDENNFLDKKILQKHVICVGFYKCLHTLVESRNISLLDSKIHMKYLIPRELTDFHSHVKVYEIDYFSHTKYLSYNTIKGFPLLKRINKVLYRIIESGLITKWLKEVEFYPQKKIISNQDIPLSLFHLEMEFYLYLGGLSIAICVFIVEILISKLFK